MGWLDIPRADEAEEIDNPKHPHGDLERSMRDLARSNRVFGGLAAVVNPAIMLLRAAPASQAIACRYRSGLRDISCSLIGVPQSSACRCASSVWTTCGPCSAWPTRALLW